MNRRAYLWIFMISMLFYTFQRDEKPMTYLYTQYKFNWDTETYSTFKTFQSSAYVICMLTGIPLMSKILGLKDTVSRLEYTRTITLSELPTFNRPAILIFHPFARHITLPPIINSTSSLTFPLKRIFILRLDDSNGRRFGSHDSKNFLFDCCNTARILRRRCYIRVRANSWTSNSINDIESRAIERTWKSFCLISCL